MRRTREESGSAGSSRRERGLPSSVLARGEGFTLLEVLVTVAIVVVVLGLAAAVLLGTLNAAPRARLRAEEETEILRVGSILRRQLLTIAASSSTRDPLVGETGKDPRTDSISVVTSSLLHTSCVGLAEWRIVQEVGQQPYLSYRETPYLGGDPVGKDPREIFSRMVRGIEIRYWSDPDWVESWKRSLLPERIRVTCFYYSVSGEGTFTVEAAPGLTLLPPGSEKAAAASPSPSASAGATPMPTASPTASFFTPAPTATTATQKGPER